MSAVPSPCLSVCRMQATSGLCEGCYRTLDEIAAWSLLDDQEKRAVWKQLHVRRVLAAHNKPTAVPPPQA